jgi:hypothetical protein
MHLRVDSPKEPYMESIFVGVHSAWEAMEISQEVTVEETLLILFLLKRRVLCM